MRYEERIIDEVQSLNDIVEVVSGFLPLKRSGRTFKALCPFHPEKTPSFTVHPEKQIFHCFGCGVGGNVFSFLMKYESLTFPEALRNLAERVHFALPEPTRAAAAQVSDSEALYEVYRLAGEYYSANLKDPEKGAVGRKYLAERGFGPEILKEFPLGWATQEWRGLFDFLGRRGLGNEILYRSGLIQRSREGNPYDLFRSRLLFPIHNLQGKLVAFGGRVLGTETPKYLNSSESSIFRKRKELFGLHLAKRHISPDESRLLVVEGYFDFLQVYLGGFQNVVATLGTALTEDHVRILKRFVEEVVVVYDGDRAGEAASLRGIEVFLEGEMNVKVATLPAGKDPDNFIQESGPEGFRKLLLEADDFFDFKWKSLTRRINPADSTGLVRIANDFLETFTKIKNSLVLDRYLKRLASLLKVEESSLRKRLSDSCEKRQNRASSFSSPSVKSSPFQFPEEVTLVALLLEEPSLFDKGDAVSQEDFKHPGAREAFQILKECHDSGAKVAHSRALNRLGDESIKSFVSSFCLVEMKPEEREKAFSDCVRKVKDRRKNEKLERLRQAISQAEGGGQNDKVSQLLNEYRTLLSQKG